MEQEPVEVPIDGMTQALVRLKEKQPVIHVITNPVTVGDVAQGLHALGARPIMASASEEVVEITLRANALVLNLGAPDPHRLEAMFQAARQANTLRIPVILDPVGVGASRFRMVAVRSFLAEIRLSAIRGNGAEIGIMAGTGGKLRGIDSAGDPADPPGAAKILAEKTGGVVVLSGPRDIISDRKETLVVENGHPLMARMTGAGCMLTAILGAFAAVEQNLMLAAAAATAVFGLAGEQAARGAKGPGTFKALLIDALFALTPEDLRSGARIRWNLA